MNLQKIGVKYFVDKGEKIPLGTFIPVFHHWIQEGKLEGLLVDVAEYSHVYQGPGVLLVAHEANYSIDEENGKRGFLYQQKRTPVNTAEEMLKTAFRRILYACEQLEKEPGLNGHLKFMPGHFRILLNDRLEAPRNPESHASLEGFLIPFLQWLYPGSKPLLLPEKDPLRRTSFEVKMEGVFEIESLLNKLSAG